MNRRAVAIGVILVTLSLPILTHADSGGTKQLKIQLDQLAKPSMDGSILLSADYNPQLNCGPCPAYDIFVSYANYGNRTAYFTNMTVSIGCSQCNLAVPQIVIVHLGNVLGRTIHSLGVSSIPTRPDSVNA